ncbi:hypothetical protein WI560_24390 [Bradyrhizobium sp. A11]|uniref:hypothetical protein n=1 Tax=Bradyrhizobium sp. A11 TaxID=3133974 RepID=UPI00324F3EC8
MHKSVYRRFEAASVLLYDRMATYRPDNMRVHVDFKHYFDDSAAQLPQCVADDIEQSEKKPTDPDTTTVRKRFCRAAFETPLASAVTSMAHHHDAESGLATWPSKTPFEKLFSSAFSNGLSR